MSRAIVTNIDQANDNIFIINVPGIGNIQAQCASNDEILLGTEVRIVDLNNLPPSKAITFGNIRFLPNTHPGQSISKIPAYLYTDGGRWKSPDELYSSDNKHALAKAYILASERNPRWQNEYPLYKKGKIIEIIDEKFMRIEIFGDMTRTCRTDYMTCDTLPFEIDDIIIIFYENGSFEKPVVIGFWDEPKCCINCDISSIDSHVYFYSGSRGILYITSIQFYNDGIWESKFSPDYWAPSSDASWDVNKWKIEFTFSIGFGSLNPINGWEINYRPTDVKITYYTDIDNQLNQYDIGSSTGITTLFGFPIGTSLTPVILQGEMATGFEACVELRKPKPCPGGS